MGGGTVKTPEQIAAGLLYHLCREQVRLALDEIAAGVNSWSRRPDGSYQNKNRYYGLGYYPKDRHFVFACGWGRGFRVAWHEHWLLMRAVRAILKEQADAK